MNEKKEIKISLKTFILIILLIILLLFILVYSIIAIINKDEDKTTLTSNSAIDYKKLYKLHIQLSNIEYNLENYTLDYYSNKYTENFANVADMKQLLKEDLSTENLQVIHIDYIVQYESGIPFIESYYFINIDDFIIVSYVYYENTDLYNKYKDSISYLATNIEFPNSNASEYENVFTNLLTDVEFPNVSDMEQYKNIANQESPLYLSYNSLTETEKEKYNEIYEKLFKRKETISLQDYSEEYHSACNALMQDAIYLGIECYSINMGWKITNVNGEEEWFSDYSNKDAFLEMYKYEIEDFSNIKYEISGEYIKNCIYLNYSRNIYGTLEETHELTDEEIETFNYNVTRIINNMPNDLSTYGKYKYLAESICNLVEYAHDELEAQNTDRIYSLVGVFVDGRAVCEGYAKAYEYLCKKAGLFCEQISGRDLNNEDSPAHAFNYIKLGNKYYFVDVTWMDEEGFIDFAFIYDEKIDNGHNCYIEWVYKNGYPEVESIIENLKNNLGTINWNDVKTFH